MNIYVGGLSPGVTDKQLGEQFATYGRVTSAEVAKDHGSGTPRGFGFVEMPSAREAVAAISALKGSTRMGSVLEVHEVRHPGPRPLGHRLLGRTFGVKNRKKA